MEPPVNYHLRKQHQSKEIVTTDSISSILPAKPRKSLIILTSEDGLIPTPSVDSTNIPLGHENSGKHSLSFIKHSHGEFFMREGSDTAGSLIKIENNSGSPKYRPLYNRSVGASILPSEGSKELEHKNGSECSQATEVNEVLSSLLDLL